MPDQNYGVGFLCASVSVLGFGSNFIPVKKYDVGDGMFFQLAQALGIFTVGVVIQLIQQSEFQPWAMLGGAIWCTGNCLSPKIIQYIGMALGQLIWSAANLITGWSMGEWGLFGTEATEAPASPELNVIGALLALLATSTYFFVKPEDQEYTRCRSQDGYKHLPSSKERTTAFEGDDETDQESNQPRLNVVKSINNSDVLVKTEQESEIGTEQKRFLGAFMGVVAGILFGTNFAPPNHLMNYPNNSQHGIDYVFSHFTGIIMTSLVWFLLYCAWKGNDPVINNKIILPGWLSGVVWGIAQACWFVANDNLGFTTAYPVITTGPGIVSTIWGVCVFGEVKGKRNLSVLGIAFFLSFLSIGLITASRTM